MKDNGGSTWITVVLITVVAILVFLVFFGYKPQETLPTIPQIEKKIEQKDLPKNETLPIQNNR